MLTIKLTDNTDLVLLQPMHAQEVFNLVDTNRDHLKPWFPWVDSTLSPEDTRQFIKKMLDGFAQETDMALGIRHNGSFVGTIGLHDINTYVGSAEIGYWLDKKHEGKGIMTLACREVINAAFNELGLMRIQIRVEPANHRSRAIPRRLGFRHEGTIRNIMRVGDRYGDLEVYSILKNEWNVIP